MNRSPGLSRGTMFRFQPMPDRFRASNRRGYDVLRESSVVGTMHIRRETGRDRGRNVMTIRTALPPSDAEVQDLLRAAAELADRERLGEARGAHTPKRSDGSWSCRLEFGRG